MNLTDKQARQKSELEIMIQKHFDESLFHAEEARLNIKAALAALRVIRDQQLYREDFPSFEEYMDATWACKCERQEEPLTQGTQ